MEIFLYCLGGKNDSKHCKTTFWIKYNEENKNMDNNQNLDKREVISSYFLNMVIQIEKRMQSFAFSPN